MNPSKIEERVEDESIRSDIDAISKIPIIPTLLEVICRTTGMGFSAIARVTETSWVACAVRDEIAFGLKPGGELILETTLCNEIRQHHQPIVIDQVTKDEIYKCHHTPVKYGFQSYISMPILRKNGLFFGTLCAIDPKPAKVNNPQTIGMFNLFADLISFHLHANEEQAISVKLAEEQEMAELREKFIAVLGHDLRNPLGAITMSAALLLDSPDAEETKELATIIKNSSSRMAALITQMLDFARAKLGSGIHINIKNCENVFQILTNIIKELKTIYPDQKIESNFTANLAFECDEHRIGQVFSNLLTNAIIYGDKNKPVEVTAKSEDDNFYLTVTNYGKEIPPNILNSLFQPFYRGNQIPEVKGLGLGLYISSEIAKAHKGKITVSSSIKETCFTFCMPIKSQ